MVANSVHRSGAVVYPACRWRVRSSWPRWIVAHRGPIVVPASSARAAIGLMRCRWTDGPSVASLAEHSRGKGLPSRYAASAPSYGHPWSRPPRRSARVCWPPRSSPCCGRAARGGPAPTRCSGHVARGRPAAMRRTEHRAGAVREQAAKVDVSPFTDPAETSARATRIFPRGQPQPTRKLPRAVKRVDVAHEPTNAVAVNSPIPGISRRRVATGSASANDTNSRSSAAMLPQAHALPRARQRARDQSAAARSPHPQGSAGIACRAGPRPQGAEPLLPKIPRSVLMRAVRVVIHCSRMRCSATSACWATRFTGTGESGPSASLRATPPRRCDRSYSVARRDGHTRGATA